MKLRKAGLYKLDYFHEIITETRSVFLERIVHGEIDPYQMRNANGKYLFYFGYNGDIVLLKQKRYKKKISDGILVMTNDTYKDQ